MRLSFKKGYPTEAVLPQAPALFVVAQAVDVQPISRAVIESVALQAGYRKHPATIGLFGFEALGEDGTTLWSAFERGRPSTAAENEQLRVERDLHADMLREPGVRSDAHVVRYELAARLVRPNDVVLDAACGLGYGTHVIASLSEADRVIGIDGSAWAVEYANRQYGSARTEFRQGMLPDVLDTLADASVDCIVSLETLEHVNHPDSLLAAFFRVLKPGGRLFVSVPNDWADASGRDPNPHHLHVYDWHRLRAELGAQFIVDAAWRLIASGCKSGERRVWMPRARLLEAVPLAEAGPQDAEWWLASAVKPPQPTAAAPYRQTVHGVFEGHTHLVDFERHYANPWLVHCLVEIPWRVQDRQALRALAEQVSGEAPAGSPDAAAGLAVRGWRIVESGEDRSALAAWLGDWQRFDAAGASANPHVVRWQVSLAYLAGRLQELHGDLGEARRCYEAVLRVDVRPVTPTLGTKSVDAAFRLGMLRWAEDDVEGARQAWRSGLDVSSACLHEDWIEFIGNAERPFPFSLNDAVETLDNGVRCALALRATSFGWSRLRVGRELAELRNRSLRSAVTRLQSRLTELGAESKRTAFALADMQHLALARADEISRVTATLATTQGALEEAQRLAWERAGELTRAQRHVEELQAAHEEVQSLARERFDEVQRLSARLDQTQTALEETQQLAVSRFAELERLADEVGQYRSLSREYEERANSAVESFNKVESERSDLVGRLAITQNAVEHAQALAIARSAELQVLSSQLDRTQSALDETQQLARQRFGEIEALSLNVRDLSTDLAAARTLAVWRADELDRRATAFAMKQAAFEAAHRLAEDRERQVDEAGRQIEQLSEQVAQLMRQGAVLDAITGELSATRANLATADEARRQDQVERDRLVKELEDTRNALAAEQERGRRLTSSLYWQAGAPLRWLAGLLK